eukprot:TRINITY_DN5116_c0_g1_i3.p1 TRINITY_DN5116_c0_g1~~TRINITY_DN5116_c0_g1_i3.p1  ORF type:complete len:373 (-),score=78.06 TRINITY_DN5116_c0_g1_i3:79-1197(-)
MQPMNPIQLQALPKVPSVAQWGFEGATVNDDIIKRTIWEGAIPIEFNLNKDEITTMTPPLPFYALASRNSYITILSNTVKDHFSNAAPAVVDEIWFDYKGIPLKWHYPVGVLYDLLVGGSLLSSGKKTELPWPLTIHFQGFPANAILRCPNEETIRQHYNNVLKEANHIKHGDNNKVNRLSLQDSNDLWDGLRLSEYDRFNNVNRQLQATIENIKFIPLRVCQLNQFNPTILQDLVAPKDDQGKDLTLADVLSQILPDLFQNQNASSSSSSSTTTTTTSTKEKEKEKYSPNTQSPSITSNIITTYIDSSDSTPNRNEPSPNTLSSSSKKITPQVIIQGIQPPLETTIFWLSEFLSPADNFLYIIGNIPQPRQ